jgi:hypothetical protein
MLKRELRRGDVGYGLELTNNSTAFRHEHLEKSNQFDS